VRVGVVFRIFEAGMPILSLALGYGLASTLADQQQLGRLLVTGIALSIDNLAAGFPLGTYHVSLPVAAS
jgi:manganese efflux pump family protein